MNLSEQEQKEVIEKGLENTKPVFFNQIEIERIFFNVINQKDSELLSLELSNFETYLDTLILKVLKPPISEVKKEQLDVLEGMKSTLNEIYQVQVINKTQTKLINELRLKLFKSKREESELKKEIIKLKKVVNF